MEASNQTTIGSVPQAFGQQQQPLIVTVQAPPTHRSVQQKRSDEEHYRKFFPKKTILGLSVFKLVAGSLSMLFQVTSIFSLNKWQDFFHSRRYCFQYSFLDIVFTFVSILTFVPHNPPILFDNVGWFVTFCDIWIWHTCSEFQQQELYSDKEYKWHCVFSCGIMTYTFHTFPFLS